MTDKERIKSINRRVIGLGSIVDSEGYAEVNVNLISNDMNWLIEQAEQVEKSKEAAQLHLKQKRNKHHELNKVWKSREKMRKTIERLDRKHASEKYELEREVERLREAWRLSEEESDERGKEIRRLRATLGYYANAGRKARQALEGFK